MFTEWERNFLTSVGEQLDNKRGPLSDKQMVILDRIYKKACDSPY